MELTKHKIGLVQTKVGPDIDANLEKTAKFVGQAAKKGAKIVCLQELFATQYFAQVENKDFFKLAEKIPGKITRYLANLAKTNGICLVGGSLYELGEDTKLYNTALIFDEKGTQIGKYRKMHIPYDPLYYEKFYFAPGNLGYIQVKTEKLTISPLICYDQWFPEAARINTLKGTQMIFYPTAIGYFPALLKAEPFSAQRWENAMRSHASLNGIFTAGVNRVGKEADITFWGGSFIADPFGEIVARASATEEEALVAEIDIAKIAECQDGWGFLRNRRPDSYGDLVK